MPQETLRPNANGYVNDFTPNIGTNYQCVDEETSDGDTTYVEESGLKEATGYCVIRENNVTSYGSPISVTKYYTEYSYAWTTKPSNGQSWTKTDIENLQIGVRAEDKGAGVDSIDLYNIERTSIPDGADISKVTVYIIIRTSPPNNFRCTQAWVVIDYTYVDTSGASGYEIAIDTSKGYGNELYMDTVSYLGELRFQTRDMDDVPPPPAIEVIHNILVSGGNRWGYKWGFKQSNGVYRNGYAVRQITDSSGQTDGSSNPDWIAYVSGGQAFIKKHPANFTSYDYVNTGGDIFIDKNGTVWYTLGGRSQDVEFRLYSSNSAYDFENFTQVLYDWETEIGSSTPSVIVSGNKVFLFWRRDGSTTPTVEARWSRYSKGSWSSPEASGALYHGITSVWLEQPWSDWDPRQKRIVVSWHCFEVDGGNNVFGSPSFCWTDDMGDNWYDAAGTNYSTKYTGFPPLYYPSGDIPYDHLALESDRGMNKGMADQGWTKNGFPYFIFPILGADTRRLRYYVYSGGSWHYTNIKDLNKGLSPFAWGGGPTKDFEFVAYVVSGQEEKLQCKVSNDDGFTWSNYTILQESSNSGIAWISFVNRLDDYDDNIVRLFYTVHNKSDPDASLKGDLKYVEFKINHV